MIWAKCPYNFTSASYNRIVSLYGGELHMGYGYGGNCTNYGGGYNRGGSTFALIVVLFILLIIVGTTFYR